jgi:hypothetical protein
MRNTLLIFLVALIFTGCKKDKFTTVPQITFKSVKPNTIFSSIPFKDQVIPVLTIGVTDAEGDLGLIEGKDTSFVYIKNLLTNDVDSSLLFPNISAVAVKDFKADVLLSLVNIIKPSTRPSPKVDTLYFEVYIKDFAKNKSNVIKTADPLYYITP